MTPIMLGTPTMPPRASEISNLRGDKTFPHTAHDGLNNVTQRRNLTKATTTIRNKRQRVIDEIDDWEDLREAGSTTKRYVMAHLPELLEQFEAAVTARGGHVHWARNAEEAGKIVTELVQATGEKKVVKIKSMATQEIALNEQLEKVGIFAQETDLAELIVQLGEDKPSHIVVPAIHRNRSAASSSRRCLTWMIPFPPSPPNWPRLPACTYGSSSWRPRSLFRALTSVSPKPGTSPLWSPKVTAACA